jgi:hypothetical protein
MPVPARRELPRPLQMDWGVGMGVELEMGMELEMGVELEIGVELEMGVEVGVGVTTGVGEGVELTRGVGSSVELGVKLDGPGEEATVEDDIAGARELLGLTAGSRPQSRSENMSPLPAVLSTLLSPGRTEIL